MIITEEINKIKLELEKVDDEDLIRTISDLLEFARKKSLRDRLEPMTAEELRRRAEESEQAINEGQVTSLDELERESAQW